MARLRKPASGDTAGLGSPHNMLISAGAALLCSTPSTRTPCRGTVNAEVSPPTVRREAGRLGHLPLAAAL